MGTGRGSAGGDSARCVLRAVWVLLALLLFLVLLRGPQAHLLALLVLVLLVLVPVLLPLLRYCLPPAAPRHRLQRLVTWRAGGGATQALALALA